MTKMFRFLAFLPLPWMHRVGALLGWLTWILSPTYRRHFKEQAAQAGYRFDQVRGAVAAAGCQALESFRVWFDAPMPVQWDGLQHIEAAYAKAVACSFSRRIWVALKSPRRVAPPTLVHATAR